jgi:hypothetical protein
MQALSHPANARRENVDQPMRYQVKVYLPARRDGRQRRRSFKDARIQCQGIASASGDQRQGSIRTRDAGQYLETCAIATDYCTAAKCG